ncbi:MAG: hypothetical protein QOF85_481 [Solirubrobacterales bacterium]|jgi:hypothetical protein|nr:hypothetical protein [Solirubrobacterales bacterium]
MRRDKRRISASSIARVQKYATRPASAELLLLTAHSRLDFF